MKLKFDVVGKHQPDPYIFEDNGKLYLYVTGTRGVEAYSADDLFGVWHYEGIVFSIEGRYEYWAPSVTKIGDRYYIYVSSSTDEEFEYMHAAVADSPLGPFKNVKCFYKRFSIDSHVVETGKGLFLWYAEDNTDCDRIGTRIYVDKLIDPMTPANQPVEMIVPTMDEEIFKRNRFGDGRDWHTIEGAFWFREGDWQYVMYSGGCYDNDSYHIGYAAARSDENDLTKVEFIKHTADGAFDPVLIKNDFEEGTGHHSVIKHKGQYYAIYHGRDPISGTRSEFEEARTARVCKLHVRDGLITAERYEHSV
ncbi:MAG: family 43 glycosylhydrolase [Clostridia bacterium]|nr:family 43 glycosylhydrolase [Clostridia bacterium]